MIEVKVSVEKDVFDKGLNTTITKGVEETFALPEKFNAVDKFTLIRGVQEFLEKTISQHDEDASPEDEVSAFEERREDK